MVIKIILFLTTFDLVLFLSPSFLTTPLVATTAVAATFSITNTRQKLGMCLCSLKKYINGVAYTTLKQLETYLLCPFTDKWMKDFKTSV